MMRNSERYPDNWDEIALAIKEAAGWRCRHCHHLCHRPHEKRPQGVSPSEWMKNVLVVHHANRVPEDNRPDNLIALCTGCHLRVHQGRHGNVVPGQLSLFDNL